MIYPVDSVIQLLNNRSQKLSESLGCILFIKFSRIVGKLELVRVHLKAPLSWYLSKSFKKTNFSLDGSEVLNRHRGRKELFEDRAMLERVGAYSNGVFLRVFPSRWAPINKGRGCS